MQNRFFDNYAWWRSIKFSICQICTARKGCESGHVMPCTYYQMVRTLEKANEVIHDLDIHIDKMHSDKGAVVQMSDADFHKLVFGLIWKKEGRGLFS